MVEELPEWMAAEQEEPDFFTRDQVLDMLRTAYRIAGSQEKYGAKHNFSGALVSQTLKRRVHPGTAILLSLGLEKVIMYRRVKNE